MAVSTKIGLHDVDETIASLVDRPVNNNILINSNFANPVNQRGVTSVTADETNKVVYFIDRWFAMSNGTTISSIITLNDGYITLEPNGTDVGASFRQAVEYLPHSIYSFSVKIDGVIYSGLLDYQGVYVSQYIDENKTMFCGLTVDKIFFIQIASTKTSVNIEWAKLELGDHATPYVPRMYAEELQLCKRYYQKFDVGNLKIYYSDSKNIWFTNTLETEMRVTPTVTIPNTVGLRNGATALSGFAFSTNPDIRSICFKCVKESHGVSNPAICNLYNGVLSLDAEL